jgi:hypothetical protein
MTITNITRVESLLADPAADISLDDLKTELNELAKLRDKSRLAFCKRLAVAYLLIVGRVPTMSSPRDDKPKKFFEWCWKNLRTANNKQYSTGTLKTYLSVGFSSNPEKLIKDRAASANDRGNRVRSLGASITHAARSETTPKVVPIMKLREKYKLPTNVAQEVNVLMRAWEQASSQARSQFIYMITGHYPTQHIGASQ